MKLYDYVENGVNQITAWASGLEKEERGRLRSKLDMLTRVEDPMQLPGILMGPFDARHPEIRKLRVGATGSKTALRPMVCRGPIYKNAEVTLLAGAKEIGGKLPPGIAELADLRREAILADPLRRCVHERI